MLALMHGNFQMQIKVFSQFTDGRKRPNPNDKAASSNSKPYECRFCPMKFAKSQALGGHMNRHRQGKLFVSILEKSACIVHFAE